ncbi:MAG: hypothetical protein MHM6MM_004270 [Cercozoa sp. M6MM]
MKVPVDVPNEVHIPLARLRCWFKKPPRDTVLPMRLNTTQADPVLVEYTKRKQHVTKSLDLVGKLTQQQWLEHQVPSVANGVREAQVHLRAVKEAVTLPVVTLSTTQSKQTEEDDAETDSVHVHIDGLALPPAPSSSLLQWQWHRRALRVVAHATVALSEHCHVTVPLIGHTVGRTGGDTRTVTVTRHDTQLELQGHGFVQCHGDPASDLDTVVTVTTHVTLRAIASATASVVTGDGEVTRDTAGVLIPAPMDNHLLLKLPEVLALQSTLRLTWSSSLCAVLRTQSALTVQIDMEAAAVSSDCTSIISIGPATQLIVLEVQLKRAPLLRTSISVFHNEDTTHPMVQPQPHLNELTRAEHFDALRLNFSETILDNLVLQRLQRALSKNQSAPQVAPATATTTATGTSVVSSSPFALLTAIDCMFDSGVVVSHEALAVYAEAGDVPASEGMLTQARIHVATVPPVAATAKEIVSIVQLQAPSLVTVDITPSTEVIAFDTVVSAFESHQQRVHLHPFVGRVMLTPTTAPTQLEKLQFEMRVNAISQRPEFFATATNKHPESTQLSIGFKMPSNATGLHSGLGQCKLSLHYRPLEASHEALCEQSATPSLTRFNCTMPSPTEAAPFRFVAEARGDADCVLAGEQWVFHIAFPN